MRTPFHLFWHLVIVANASKVKEMFLENQIIVFFAWQSDLQEKWGKIFLLTMRLET